VNPISNKSQTVMAGLVPAIHDLAAAWVIMDGRHEGGHDGGWMFGSGGSDN
jgi:hypothetical protein